MSYTDVFFSLNSTFVLSTLPCLSPDTPRTWAREVLQDETRGAPADEPVGPYSSLCVCLLCLGCIGTAYLIARGEVRKEFFLSIWSQRLLLSSAAIQGLVSLLDVFTITLPAVVGTRYVGTALDLSSCKLCSGVGWGRLWHATSYGQPSYAKWSTLPGLGNPFHF